MTSASAGERIASRRTPRGVSTASIPKTSDVILNQFLSQSLNVCRLLDQDQTWVDIDGNHIRIDDMSVSYKRNLLRFLTKRARNLANRYAFGAHLNLAGQADYMGEMALDSVEAALAEDERLGETEPTRWLHQTRLGKRLLHDVNNRIGGTIS